MTFGLVLGFLSICVVFIEAILTYADGMFLPSQMVRRYPVGFPFIANGGMWGDLLLLSPALCLIGRYAADWSGWEIVLALTVGMVVSFLMHDLVYLRGKFPDSLAGGGRPISKAGWVHVFYFGAALAAIILFYFYSHAAPVDVIIIGILLFLHIVIANHVPLQALNSHLYFPWCSDIFAEETNPLWILTIASALLAAVTVFKLW